MSSNFSHNEAIVLAPAWPSKTGGYGIALHASLLLYLEHFSVVHFICISDRAFNAETWPADRIKWTQIPIIAKPKWLRFFISLFGVLPAITARYALARQEVMHAVHCIFEKRIENPHIIIEDIPMACFLPDISRDFPDVPIGIRSHNMTEKAFEGFCHVGSPFHRLAWRLELPKIRHFEKSIFEIADSVWGISKNDVDEYSNRFSCKLDGVLGVCLDGSHYQKVGPGKDKTVVHVGTADMRKGKGLEHFIRRVWPTVRSEVPGARLILAGRGTQQFTNTDLGVEGLGFVADDRDVLGKGRIFVNPQQIGSGVQLKSIVAMLAGKSLVSTSLGVEGVKGKRGEHFEVADSPEEMGRQIISLMRDFERASRIGRLGRDLAMKIYSTEWFLEESRPLLDSFVRKSQ